MGKNGGERGIRTPEERQPQHAFQACALSHSAISPHWVLRFSDFLRLRQWSSHHKLNVFWDSAPHPPVPITHQVFTQGKKYRHYPVMKYVLTIIGIIFGCLGLAATWKDVMAPDRSWHVVGEVWFEWAPTSLQITETVISRYIDPCGLLVSLDCEPFLWHPVISVLLGWYAAPVFILLGLGFALSGRWLGLRKKKKARA